MPHPQHLEAAFDRLTILTVTGPTRTGAPLTLPFVYASADPNPLLVAFDATFARADVRCGDLASVGGQVATRYAARPGEGAALCAAFASAQDARTPQARRRLETMQAALQPVAVMPSPLYVTRLASAAVSRRALTFTDYELGFPLALVRLAREWLASPPLRRARP
ncbi:hypothetical protein [Lacticaseibacillus kribbianus]|uniref:hypothetical protein n=1 Tax=Lacticaseibacillus kribbianus TaxID=2926292 RepID=UPI001CD23623|nr:hypothetical protein [Lacticaseibacillus kribbianus]